MTAEEYLNKLVDIDKRISAIRRAIEKCYARAESTSPQNSDIPPSFTGGTSRKIEDSVVMIAVSLRALSLLRSRPSCSILQSRNIPSMFSPVDVARLNLHSAV